MIIEHKALLFALELAVVIPACTIVTEKPADSTPPVAPAPPATTVATVAPPTTVVVVPVVTATATASATATAAPTTSSTLPVPGAILKPPKKVAQ
jgi:hypothetical protein